MDRNYIDERLHELSLDAIDIFKELYNSNDDHGEKVDKALDAYRAIRRAMDVGPDGKRLYSEEAYHYMQS